MNWVYLAILGICGVATLSLAFVGLRESVGSARLVRSMRESERSRLTDHINELGRRFHSPHVCTSGLLEITDRARTGLLQSGLQAMADHHYVEAIAHFRECMGVAATENQKTALLILVGNCFASLGQFLEAESHYHEAAGICRHVYCWDGLAIALCNMANLHWLKMDTEKALLLYQEALDIRKRMFDKTGEAIVLGKIAVLQRNQGNKDVAKNYLRQSASLLKELDAQPLLGELYDEFERA